MENQTKTPSFEELQKKAEYLFSLCDELNPLETEAKLKNTQAIAKESRESLSNFQREVTENAI